MFTRYLKIKEKNVLNSVKPYLQLLEWGGQWHKYGSLQTSPTFHSDLHGVSAQSNLYCMELDLGDISLDSRKTIELRCVWCSSWSTSFQAVHVLCTRVQVLQTDKIFSSVGYYQFTISSHSHPLFFCLIGVIWSSFFWGFGINDSPLISSLISWWWRIELKSTVGTLGRLINEKDLAS